MATVTERPVKQLIKDSLAVIDEAYALVGRQHCTMPIVPLFSGGYDSYSACKVASFHDRFRGCVFHIDTGIGSEATRAYVEKVCKAEGWALRVLKSADTYEKFVTILGFPGPGAHQWVYNWLKDRCISRLTSEKSGLKHGLITGCRSQESTRRMGHTEKIQVGERSRKTGRMLRRNRVWIAVCHDWSNADQVRFRNEYLPYTNPVKDSVLGMSGECFCGAFASEGELERIEEIVPDVHRKIMRLQTLAKDAGTPCLWGKTPAEGRDALVETGPMCQGCDRRASMAGVKFVDGCTDKPPKIKS